MTLSFKALLQNYQSFIEVLTTLNLSTFFWSKKPQPSLWTIIAVWMQGFSIVLPLSFLLKCVPSSRFSSRWESVVTQKNAGTPVVKTGERNPHFPIFILKNQLESWSEIKFFTTLTTFMKNILTNAFLFIDSINNEKMCLSLLEQVFCLYSCPTTIPYQ